MNRYQFTKIQQDRYRTTRYPKFAKQQSDLYIISREGDRLDLLANEFYEDPRYWWVIAWWNAAPTEADLVPGSPIAIPLNLQEALQILGV